ncbi:hypothetical protein CSE45_5053 [Citreicella sp. SE45]|nr:hypothetical protein CSE45_5053 [Citreicella sp. SE45]
MLNPSDLPPLPIAERLLAQGGDRLGSGMAEQRRRLLRPAASGRARAVRIQSGDHTRSLFLVKM